MTSSSKGSNKLLNPQPLGKINSINAKDKKKDSIALSTDAVKPVIFYSGDLGLFKTLEPQISTTIPNDSCEWRRSYGRPTKTITFRNVKFKEFEVRQLEKFKSSQWSMIDQPVLYIYCTECNDVETYKATVKEEIEQWMKILVNYKIDDWMILLVETLDMKRTKNILPRTTVLDKIRLDFGSKHGDRVISILNPTKFEAKSTESFRTLVQRIRFLMLSGYNNNINKYEELIRQNRDKRQKEGWSFLKYFLLQEDLAFILEMLDLHSEALVQYDELDAMLSQSIINSVYGEKPLWLKMFSQPVNRFSGINLSKKQLAITRTKITDGTIGLLDLKTYILERQCRLIDSSDKPWEIAERLMPFFYATESELEIMGVDISEGALACWEFICALEVLNLCDSVQDSKDIFKCSKHSAAIWNLAKDKLYELGTMGGLLPKQKAQTSEQIHKMVLLCAGMEVDPQIDPQRSPRTPRKVKKAAVDQLKESLGSQKPFIRLYLELNELSISTYKHVSRLRFARLVGLDLGDFYVALEEYHKAIIFYTDILRELKLESWTFLSGQILIKLSHCYKKLENKQNYAKTCAAASCCVELDIVDRMTHFDEFLKNLYAVESLVQLEDHLTILDIVLLTENPVLQDTFVNAMLKIESNFPREFFVDKIEISIEMCEKGTTNEESLIPLGGEETSWLPMKMVLDYKQDGTLNCASVAFCGKGKPPARRTSSANRKISINIASDFTNSLLHENVCIKPGINFIELTFKATRVGNWILKHVRLSPKNMKFLSEPLAQRITFEVYTKPSSAVLSFKNLIAGLEQPMKLIVTGGSFHFPKETSILIKCSMNLRMRMKQQDDANAVEGRQSNFEREMLIKLPNFKSFDESIIELEAYCDLTGRKDDKPIEQKALLIVPWNRNEITIPLHFIPALSASCRLHSAGTKKFLQVILKSSCDFMLTFSNPDMQCASEGVSLIDFNSPTQGELEISKDIAVTYIYKLEIEPLKTEVELEVIHVDFSIDYSPVERPLKRQFNVSFDLKDYTTLFRIEAKIDGLCRVNSVCHMQLTIIKIHESKYTDLMYEVLADQNFWAVVGRSAGVITLNEITQDTVVLDVMPLISGYLPLPGVRLSKYVTAGHGKPSDSPRLLPFAAGQVYNASKSMQVHILGCLNPD